MVTHSCLSPTIHKSNCSGIPKVFYVGCTPQSTGRAVLVGGEARWWWRWGWGPMGRSPSARDIGAPRSCRAVVLNR